jgi:hypothetical protein
VPRRITRCSAVALTVFAFGAANYAAAATHTTAAVYRAFSAGGRIVPHIRVQSGYCWSASDVTPRGAKAKYGLWGFPDRASQPWTIFSAPLRATKLSARVAISRAWM